MSVSTRHLTMNNRDRKLYTKICQQRELEFAAHIATMVPVPELGMWATDMTSLYGPQVRRGAFVVDWLTALMIVRYGEAVVADPGSVKIYLYDGDGEPILDANGDHDSKRIDGWPTQFQPDDLARAEAWLRGSMVPGNIQYLGGIG